MLQGIYIDDHVVVGVVKRSQKSDPQAPDLQLINNSRLAYKKENLPLSESKSFSNAEVFTAWGTEVNSLT